MFLHHLQIHGKFEKCAVGHSGPKVWLNNHVMKKKLRLTVTTLFAQSLSVRESSRGDSGLGFEGQAMELSFGKAILSGIFLLHNHLSFQSPFLPPMVPQVQQEALLTRIFLKPNAR